MRGGLLRSCRWHSQVRAVPRCRDPGRLLVARDGPGAPSLRCCTLRVALCGAKEICARSNVVGRVRGASGPSRLEFRCCSGALASLEKQVAAIRAASLATTYSRRILCGAMRRKTGLLGESASDYVDLASRSGGRCGSGHAQMCFVRNLSGTGTTFRTAWRQVQQRVKLVEEVQRLDNIGTESQALPSWRCRLRCVRFFFDADRDFEAARTLGHPILARVRGIMPTVSARIGVGRLELD